MPEAEELMKRLQQLEDGYYGDKRAAREQQFMDSYGSRFNGNKDLGLAILNELDRQGVDTSAADEAVTQILDELRTECNELLNMINNVQDTAQEKMDKIDKVADVISEQLSGNPEADAGPAPTEPAAEMPAESAADVPAEPAPAEMPAESAADVPAEPAPAEPAPAEPVPEPPAEPENNPAMTVSDRRMKTIQSLKSRFASKKAPKPAAPKLVNSFKPSAGMLEAAQRGW